ncbi:MAG: murein hydrolase activator EnvC [Actinomycetota bacterium]|nr:peptidoglycan DD-metalloendopeptidase family protein [Actinomycetota bacterium]
MKRSLPALVAALLLSIALPAAAFAEATPSASPSESPSPSPVASAAPSASPATKETRVDEARKKLREDQAKNGDLLDLLQKTDELRTAAEKALLEITHQLEEITKALAAFKVHQQAARIELAQKSAELVRAVKTLDRQRGILNDRASHLYQIGPAGFLPYVIGAANVNDAMMAEEYGRYALEADTSAVIAFRAAAGVVRRARREVAMRKHSLDAQVASATAQKKALQDLHNRQDEIRRELFSSMGLKVGALSKLLHSANPFASVLASYSSAGNGFTNLINEAQEGEKKAAFVADWLKRPVPGRVTSPYGWRIHPVYGYLSFHTGADFAADLGTPLHPVAPGTIIDAGYFGAFGSTVIIDHGNHIATIYAHLSRIFVMPGDRVTLKTLIGEVGSTGWSTGPHLHFEVRVNGKPDEPTHWL